RVLERVTGPARLLPCRREIGHPDLDDRVGAEELRWRWGIRVLGLWQWSELGPDAVDLAIEGRDPQIVAYELISIRHKGLGRPGVILKSLSGVGGARKGDRGLGVLGIIATVVKDDVDRAACRVDG